MREGGRLFFVIFLLLCFTGTHLAVAISTFMLFTDTFELFPPKKTREARGVYIPLAVKSIEMM